uniref:Sugar phosphate transporter domain-containing protein n=1 Tax=Chrysotila carterae TaxID=13221 RepID=A0A7S4AZS3_CHRCT|mmetsp:Transcript_21671/g.47376  ORF Transcript_21671/g.47376 Transcript_21671/m.47376 type:complete len:356 (+) Transcript_21671:182-1249(+)
MAAEKRAGTAQPAKTGSNNDVKPPLVVASGSEMVEASVTPASAIQAPSGGKLSAVFFSAGVIGSGVAHALLQEGLSTTMSAKTPLLLTAFEFGVCCSLSAVWLVSAGRYQAQKANPPLASMIKISLLVFASLVCGNVALGYVSYPIKVLIKSCKLLPTMSLGRFVLGKTYSLADHIAALLLCAGLVGFTLADRMPGKVEKQTSPIGVGLLFFAVCCDAVQVLLQERMMRADRYLTPMHVMLYTNGLAFIPVFCGIFLTGEVNVIPASLPWWKLVCYGGTSWVGVCCFIALTRTWGGTGAVLTTNSRKLLTIIFSFIFFPKPWNPGLLVSAGTILAGVGLHGYTRSKAKATPKRAE